MYSFRLEEMKLRARLPQSPITNDSTSSSLKRFPKLLKGNDLAQQEVSVITRARAQVMESRPPAIIERPEVAEESTSQYDVPIAQEHSSQFLEENKGDITSTECGEKDQLIDTQRNIEDPCIFKNIDESCSQRGMVFPREDIIDLGNALTSKTSKEILTLDGQKNFETTTERMQTSAPLNLLLSEYKEEESKERTVFVHIIQQLQSYFRELRKQAAGKISIAQHCLRSGEEYPWMYENLRYDQRAAQRCAYALHSFYCCPADAESDPVRIRKQRETHRKMIARKREKEDALMVRPDNHLCTQSKSEAAVTYQAEGHQVGFDERHIAGLAEVQCIKGKATRQDEEKQRSKVQHISPNAESSKVQQTIPV